MTLFILHSQFPSHIRIISYSLQHQISILSTLSNRKAQSLVPSLIFSAAIPPHSWHNSCNICICHVAPYRTTSWALHLRCQKRYNFVKSLSSSIPEFFDLFRIFTKLPCLLLSPHTAAVGCWEPPDGLPVCSGVHERHCLKACRPTAWMSAHIMAQDAAVFSQNLKRHVIVPSWAHARPHTVLKEHDFIWIIA